MTGSRKLVDAYVQLSARGAGALNSTLGGVVGSARRAYGALSNIAQIAVGNALAGGVQSALSALKAIPSTMISANAAFETARVGLEVLLGSADAARARIEELRKFSASTPFELPGILQASKQLEMANVPAERHMAVLRMTGDMASAAGQDIGDLSMWVSRAYAAMQAGKPWGEAAQRLSEMGVLSVDARAKLERLTEEGKSGAEVWAAFEAEMGRFGGMMEKQSKTFTGLMSTLKDSVNQFLMTVGGPLFSAAKAGLESLVGALGGDEAASAATAIADALIVGFERAAQFLAPLAPLAMEWWNALVGLVGSFGDLTGAASSFGGVVSSRLGLAISMSTALWEVLSAVSSVIWNLLVAGLRAMGFEFETTGDVAVGVMDYINDAIDAVAAAFRNWDLSLQYAWLHLQNFSQNAWEVLKALGQNVMIVFQNLPAYIEAVVQAAVTMLGNLATNVVIAFRYVFEWIKSWFSGGGGGWKDAFANAVQMVWDGMKWLIETIWGALKSLWNSVTSGFASGLQVAGENYAEAIKNATDEHGKPKLEFIPITKGVQDAFKDLPEMVQADTRTARERYGKELDALDAEWNRREQKRKDQAKAAGDAMKKVIEDQIKAPVEEGRKTGAALEKRKSEAASGGASARREGGDILGAEQFWARVQKAGMESKLQEEAQKTRKEQLDATKAANKKLDAIIDKIGPSTAFA